MTARGFMEQLARYRLHLSFLLFVAVTLEWQLDDGGRPHPLLSAVDTEHVLGVLLIVAGLLLRSWAAGVIQKRDALAITGPYALVRHPLYVGSFLVALGLAESMEDGLALILVLLAIPLIYRVTIRAEERVLVERFGAAWDNYAARTRAILPRLAWPVSSDWSYRRWWRNREWRVLVRTGAVLWLLEWWNTANWS